MLYYEKQSKRFELYHIPNIMSILSLKISRSEHSKLLLSFEIVLALSVLFSFKNQTILISLLKKARIGAHITPRRLLFQTNRTMSSPAVRAAQAALASVDLSHYDPEQSRLMDEKCILVDEEDIAIGAMDKKTCKYHHISQSLAWFTLVIRPSYGKY